jgi:hypothetical protein
VGVVVLAVDGVVAVVVPPLAVGAVVLLWLLVWCALVRGVVGLVWRTAVVRLAAWVAVPAAGVAGEAVAAGLAAAARCGCRVWR